MCFCLGNGVWVRLGGRGGVGWKFGAGGWASSQAVRASLPFLWCALWAWGCWSLCVVEWGVGVWGRVTRSVVGASDLYQSYRVERVRFFLFILAMRRVEHCASAFLMWCSGLCGCMNRKCALGESGRGEQSRARAKAVELWWGREWLGVRESCGWVWALVRLYPHLGRATRGVGRKCVVWVKCLCNRLVAE